MYAVSESTSVGESYARFLLTQCLEVEEGETYNASTINNVIESFKFKEDAEREILLDQNFASLTNAFLVEPVKLNHRLPVLPCYIPEMILLRLPHWTPWQTLVEYLNSIGIEPVVLFKNEVIYHNDIAMYACEIRLFVSLNVSITI